MQNLLFEAPLDINDLLNLLAQAEHTFLKFLSPNDLGLTGSHQAGIYLPGEAWRFFLQRPGQKGENFDSEVFSLDWGAGRRTFSCFKWYGKESVNEYRLTRMRDFFRGQEERYLGSLFILVDSQSGYQARVLEAEADIDTVLNFLGITPRETNRMLRFDLDTRLEPYCEELAAQMGQNFPDTETISRRAQKVARELYDLTESSVHENPDRTILQLIDIEYALFRFMERQIYGRLLDTPFGSVEELLRLAIEINNRRKSRAGRALENHLRFILVFLRLPHEFEAHTEDRKKPDFLFPGSVAYRDLAFPVEKLFFLGAKTTCKDRWRQILNEADRIVPKHLFTLQQGITTAQLTEMREANVIPVVPLEYHRYFKPTDQDCIMSLKNFVELVQKSLGQTEDLFNKPAGLDQSKNLPASD